MLIDPIVGGGRCLACQALPRSRQVDGRPPAVHRERAAAARQFPPAAERRRRQLRIGKLERPSVMRPAEPTKPLNKIVAAVVSRRRDFGALQAGARAVKKSCPGCGIARHTTGTPL
jgi:hypothetical protein